MFVLRSFHTRAKPWPVRRISAIVNLSENMIQITFINTFCAVYLIKIADFPVLHFKKYVNLFETNGHSVSVMLKIQC